MYILYKKQFLYSLLIMFGINTNQTFAMHMPNKRELPLIVAGFAGGVLATVMVGYAAKRYVTYKNNMNKINIDFSKDSPMKAIVEQTEQRKKEFFSLLDSMANPTTAFNENQSDEEYLKKQKILWENRLTAINFFKLHFNKDKFEQYRQGPIAYTDAYLNGQANLRDVAQQMQEMSPDLECKVQ